MGSGFPGILGAAPRLRNGLLDAYLQRIIDRDLLEQGYEVRRPETLRRWLAAYGAASSTTMATSRLLDATTAGDGAQPAKTTTIAYRDRLTQLWLLDPVPGWTPSPTARSVISSRRRSISSPTRPWPHGSCRSRRALCSGREEPT